MAYRDDTDGQRSRLREIEREVGEIDGLIFEIDGLRAERSQLATQAARIRQRLLPAVLPPRLRRWRLYVGVGVVTGLVALVASYAVLSATRNCDRQPCVAAPIQFPEIPREVSRQVGFEDGTPADCVPALAGNASDPILRACAKAGQLGRCHLYASPGGLACDSYVGVDGLCGPSGCEAPLSGTGCADRGYYRARPDWRCGQGDEAACMLRRLVEWGVCTQVHEPTPTRRRP